MCISRDGAPTLTRIELDTDGQVPGVDAPQFQACADTEEAKRVCPVSRALAGIPEIVLTATLAEGV